VRVVVVEGGVQNIGPSSSEMIVNRKWRANWSRLPHFTRTWEGTLLGS
jgi:hypothetical protein